MPFWKKIDKGGKKKPPKPAVPRTAQQSIPMQRMFEDGTCRVKPNYYTRTVAYQDINYQLAQQEDKTAIFEEWCSFLNFFDSSIKFELSFVNMATDSSEFEKSIRIPYQKDGFDDVRAEYSQMLRQQLAKGNNGLTKTKFITFGVEGESMRQVKARLDHIQNDLLNNFHRLGVQAKPLNGAERLKLMHDMFNMDAGAWELGGKGYIAIQSTDEGWDYTIYHSDYSVLDGGQVDAPELTIQEVREQILEARHMEKGRRLLQDYDVVMEKTAEAEELGLNQRHSTLEKLAALAGAKEKCDTPECSPAGCRKARDVHEL